MSRERARRSQSGLQSFRRGRRWDAALLAATALLVLASIALQARWLGRLGDLLRERMRSSLESATLGTVERLDLELIRWKLERAGTPDTVPSAAPAGAPSGPGPSWWVAAPSEPGDDLAEGRVRSAVRDAMEASRGKAEAVELADSVGSSVGGTGLRLEVARRLLFPALEGEIARLSQLDVAIEVAVESSRADRRVEPVFRSAGWTPDRVPDVESRLFAVSSAEPVLIPAADASTDSEAPVAAFVPGGRESDAADRSDAGEEWRLRVWLRSGSVDSAIGGLRARNVAVAALVTLLLAGSGLLLARLARAREGEAQARAAVLAGISHELRTPLTVIRSASENLAAGVVRDADEVAEYGALLEREAERLTETVEGTLRLASELGRQAGSSGVAADVGVLARDAVERVATAGAAERVVVRAGGTAVASETWLERSDPEALRTAIANLVRNALAYSPPGSAVEVCVEEGSGEVRVRVEDRGPGIGSGERRRVLEPFERGEAAVGGPAGVGLGLTLAALVARRHGGALTIEDREGGGARISLHLPHRSRARAFGTPEGAAPEVVS